MRETGLPSLAGVEDAGAAMHWPPRPKRSQQNEGAETHLCGGHEERQDVARHVAVSRSVPEHHADHGVILSGGRVADLCGERSEVPYNYLGRHQVLARPRDDVARGYLGHGPEESSRKVAG